MMRTRHLTVMFTDIVGYTELTRRVSHAELEEVLSDHERLVRAAAAARSGRIVKNLGDSFLVVFKSVRDGLDAATEIQAEVSERNRTAPPTRAFSVKVVVNTGDVSVADDGDIFGDPVNVCSRMEKVATGGEILFSEAAYLAANTSDIQCEEFGKHDFSGVDRPVKLYRLVRERQTSGYVDRAIVYTDIESFLDVSEHDPTAAERLIALHDELFFQTASRLGGFVQSVFGDGTLLSFESVDKAAEAMCQCFEQLERRNQRNGEKEQLRVRCSIHWGRVIFIRGRMFGDPVNRCFRLQAGADPMTIVASGTVRDMLEGDAGFAFTALAPIQHASLESPLPCFALRRAPAKPAAS